MEENLVDLESTIGDKWVVTEVIGQRPKKLKVFKKFCIENSESFSNLTIFSKQIGTFFNFLRSRKLFHDFYAFCCYK